MRFRAKRTAVLGETIECVPAPATPSWSRTRRGAGARRRRAARTRRFPNCLPRRNPRSVHRPDADPGREHRRRRFLLSTRSGPLHAKATGISSPVLSRHAAIRPRARKTRLIEAAWLILGPDPASCFRQTNNKDRDGGDEQKPAGRRQAGWAAFHRGRIAPNRTDEDRRREGGCYPSPSTPHPHGPGRRPGDRLASRRDFQSKYRWSGMIAFDRLNATLARNPQGPLPHAAHPEQETRPHSLPDRQAPRHRLAAGRRRARPAGRRAGGQPGRRRLGPRRDPDKVMVEASRLKYSNASLSSPVRPAAARHHAHGDGDRQRPVQRTGRGHAGRGAAQQPRRGHVLRRRKRQHQHRRRGVHARLRFLRQHLRRRRARPGHGVARRVQHPAGGSGQGAAGTDFGRTSPTGAINPVSKATDPARRGVGEPVPGSAGRRARDRRLQPRDRRNQRVPHQPHGAGQRRARSRRGGERSLGHRADAGVRPRHRDAGVPRFPARGTGQRPTASCRRSACRAIPRPIRRARGSPTRRRSTAATTTAPTPTTTTRPSTWPPCAWNTISKTACGCRTPRAGAATRRTTC